MPQSKAFSFDTSRRRRRPSLTPMVDVVFLLLVFFMLASRFGQDVALPLSPAVAGAGSYQGAPRLITVTADGARLNGVAFELSALPDELRKLMPDENAIVVVRPDSEAALQDMVSVIDELSDAGIRQIVIPE
ncbi:MAG: biopolymer transporter ExbD [Pseudomonadota bacterium]